MTADISETRAQPPVHGMTTDASATAAQPSLPQALPPVPAPRRDGRNGRTGLPGPAVRPRGTGQVFTHPRADRGGLAAQLARERLVTLELQRAILPLHDEPFDAPGLRIAMRYLPASRDSRLRGALAGLAITGSAPDRLVSWLNDLVHHVAPEHTASVVAGYFDPLTRSLAWAQAGHPPPVLVRGQTAGPLDPPPGVLLGAAKEPYEDATVALQPDDLLLLYSDGLIERRDRSLDEGLATLCTAVRGARVPESAIAAALRALGTTGPEDDTCLVALRIL